VTQRVFTLPPMTISMIVIGGALTAVFDGVPYKRRINSLVVSTELTSQVAVYRGIISDAALIATHPVAAGNTYMPSNRDEIPAGFPVFVVLTNVATGSARATMVFEGSY
jgi:hypothetical protein